MKKITEADLFRENVLQDKSRAAVVVFSCGLLGILSCLVTFWLTANFIDKLVKLEKMAAEKRFEMTPDDRLKLQEKANQMTESFFQYASPLFLSANFLWIIGGYAWSFDLRKNISNKLIWKLGGILVLINACVCVIAWVWMIRMLFK